MESPDIRRRFLQNLQKIRLNGVNGFRDLLFGYFQRVKLRLVKFGAAGQYCPVAVFADVIKNIGNDGRNVHRRGHPGENL